MELDHILVAAADPGSCVPRDRRWDELEPHVGGRHPGWGTANWIVPLGRAYLELVAIVDERKALESAFGRWVAAAADGELIGWAVRPDDLDATASRLGLDVSAGSRTLPSGKSVAWRMAGVEASAERPWLPFFIEWADPATFPGRSRPARASIEQVTIECERDELDTWLGKHSLPIDVHSGAGGVSEVTLRGPRGAIVLGGPASL